MLMASLHGWLKQGVNTPQCSVLPPVTTVKNKVKGQAKIVKVKGQT